MEIVPYIFSVLLTALVMRWSCLAVARKPGTPLSGLFAYRDKPGKALPPAAKSAPRW
jgi:hypothetical protein